MASSMTLKLTLIAAFASAATLSALDASAKKALPQIFATAQLNAPLRACLGIVPASEDKAKWLQSYGWPLVSTISSKQLEALLSLPQGSSANLGQDFSLDCSKPAEPPHSIMFTRKSDGAWSISGYM
jgi:hypothetical protein